MTVILQEAPGEVLTLSVTVCPRLAMRGPFTNAMGVWAGGAVEGVRLSVGVGVGVGFGFGLGLGVGVFAELGIAPGNSVLVGVVKTIDETD